MPSPVIDRPVRRRPLLAYCLGGALAAGFAQAALLSGGCREAHRDVSAREASRMYPPKPQVTRVVALGTLSGAPSPTKSERELAMFLFGAEPPPSLTIANPAGLAARDGTVLICDNALNAVVSWDAATGRVRQEQFRPSLEGPFAVDVAPTGDRLICDRECVVRSDATGGVLVRYTLEKGPFKPAGVLAVDEEVWITNLAAHRVEVFDGGSGEHLRSVGGHGTGPGQFAMPRGLARTPDGNVCVVDMLNNRVQVFDVRGNWLGNVGQPGDRVGSFGRPKAVAVGPDGTIFVTDAFSQRVHAFAADSQPLLAFGEPGSGVGELTLPGDIAITTVAPQTEYELPLNTSPAYYLLVAEQLNQPGVRVYAWLGVDQAELSGPPPVGEVVGWRPPTPESVAINPHWHDERCTACHTEEDGQLAPIPPEKVDGLCISCHDGEQAPADPHPIGRPAETELVRTPADWPTVDGVIGCLTCHDVTGHCRRGARRPAVNRVLLRGYDPQRPLEYCTSCHQGGLRDRFSPHRQRDASGRVRDEACLFCHTQRPEVPTDGRRRFQPHLWAESSDLCLNCHSKHWDISSRGHVDRPVTPEIRQWMLMRELSLEHNVSRQRLAELAADPNRRSARLPLGNGLVTCYSCHNPHYSGLFPAGSELGALASNPQERASALRANWTDLCSGCHRR